MIVIPNFVQANHLYQQGRIPLRLLQEQAMVLIGINSGHYVDEAFDIGDSDIEWLLQQPESSEDYNGLLGGEVNAIIKGARLELNPAKPLAPNSPGVATNSKPRFSQGGGVFLLSF